MSCDEIFLVEDNEISMLLQEGIPGPPGPTGPPGPAGMVWREAWDGSTAYALNDAVAEGGSAYICILAHTNHVPPNGTYWDVLAAAGATGAAGADGTNGAISLIEDAGTPMTVRPTLNFGSGFTVADDALNTRTTVTNDGIVNPMNTEGDMILAGAAGYPSRLPVGADNAVLTVDPVTHEPAWLIPVGFIGTLDSLVDVAISSPVNGDVLTYNTGSTLWVNSPPSGGGGGGGGVSITTGPYASLPAPSTAGNLYFANDVPYVLRDTGTAWGRVGPSAGKPWYWLPPGWDTVWAAAAAAAGSAPAEVAILMDSFGAGGGSTDWPTKASQHLIAAGLKTKYGAGGDFWPVQDSAAWVTPGGGTYVGTPTWVLAGGAAAFFTQGLNLARFDNGATGTIGTFTSPAACTTVVIWWYQYLASGSFQYSIDGGGLVTVSYTSGTQGTMQSIVVGSLANTTHTVALSNPSGNNALGIVGITTYQSATTGVRVARAAFWGGTLAAFYTSLSPISAANSATRTIAAQWRGAAMTSPAFPCSPHLAIIALSLNDSNAPVAAETYERYLGELIHNFRAGRAGCAILLLIQNYPLSGISDATGPGDGREHLVYVNKIRALAAANNCGLIDLAAKWGETPYTDGLQGLTDWHPTDAGHAAIAAVVAAIL